MEKTKNLPRHYFMKAVAMTGTLLCFDTALADTPAGDSNTAKYGLTDKQRNPWYVGFELGPNAGQLPRDEQLHTLGDYAELGDAVPTIEGGLTLGPQLLIGLRSASFSRDFFGDSDENAGYWINETTNIDNYTLVITHFPRGSGQFMRFGIGLSNFNYYYNKEKEYEPADSSLSDTQREQFYEQQNQEREANRIHENFSVFGPSTLVSIGYAFWVGNHANISISANYSGHFFATENAAHLGSINFGLWWF